MEGLYGDRSWKDSKQEALSNFSPINPPRDHCRFFGAARSSCYIPSPNSPIFDPYASPDSTTSGENLDSPLIRYLRSGSPVAASGDSSNLRPRYHGNNNNTGSVGCGQLRRSLSPLSAIENLEKTLPPSKSPQVFKTPVKVEEEVLVMDAILVGSAAGAKIKSSSSGSGGASSSGSNYILYKTDMCRAWEDFGTCHYGSKCLFAHGKEELRPIRFANKSKSEETICKAYTLGFCIQGTKCRFVHHQGMAAALPTEPPTTPLAMAMKTISPFKHEHATTIGSRGRTTNFTSTDWFPEDDGIKIELPPSASTAKTPSKEEVNAYIQGILYGPIQGKRLPVFAKICPE